MVFLAVLGTVLAEVRGSAKSMDRWSAGAPPEICKDGKVGVSGKKGKPEGRPTQSALATIGSISSAPTTAPGTIGLPVRSARRRSPRARKGRLVAPLDGLADALDPLGNATTSSPAQAVRRPRVARTSPPGQQRRREGQHRGHRQGQHPAAPARRVLVRVASYLMSRPRAAPPSR